MRLGDYMNKHICEPCGVSDITFVSLPCSLPTSSLPPPRLITLHHAQPISLPRPNQLVSPHTPRSFEPTPTHLSRLACAHFRWRDGSVTPRGKITQDDVVDHLGGAGAFATARGTVTWSGAFSLFWTAYLRDGGLVRG